MPKIEDMLLILWSLFWLTILWLVIWVYEVHAIDISYSSSPDVNMNVYINGEIQGNGHGTSTLSETTWMKQEDFQKIDFPMTLPGLCYDGVQKLVEYYPKAKIAYNPEPAPGHVWIITESNQPIDSYYGQQNGYYWKHPKFILNNITMLDMKIQELTGVKI
jgi:hypothetical protein